MNRADFMTRLRRGLPGLPPAAIDDISSDYDTHFADGLAAGRSEQEVAAALGDPNRLARELRAEAGLRKWDEQKNPSAAASAVFAVLGLGALDIIVLLPILMGVLATLFGLFVAVVAGLFAGAIVFAAGPFAEPPGGPVTAILLGIGIMAISTCIGAILTMVSAGLVNALVWYGRLHYRLLKPALDAQA